MDIQTANKSRLFFARANFVTIQCIWLVSICLNYTFSLGDHLIGVTTESSLSGISVIKEFLHASKLTKYIIGLLCTVYCSL